MLPKSEKNVENHYKEFFISIINNIWLPVAYITKEVTPSLVKLPLTFNGGLGKLWVTCFVK